MNEDIRSVSAVEPGETVSCWCCQDGLVAWEGILVHWILDDILVGIIVAGEVYPISLWWKAGMRRTDVKSALAGLEEGGVIRRLGQGWFEVLGFDEPFELESVSGGSGE